MSKGKQVKGDQLQFAVQAAKIGIWDWYVPDDEVIWDDQCKALVGRPDANSTLDYEFFLATLHSDDRERVNAQSIIRMKTTVSNTASSDQIRVSTGLQCRERGSMISKAKLSA